MSKAAFSLRRISEIDLALCVRCNRASRYRAMRATFRLASRLGDGVVWYALMAILPLAYGSRAWPVVLQMLIGGVVGLVAYKCLKRKTLRLRPFQAHSVIVAAAAPLDRFSFPSGHTLHAFSMSLIVSHSFSELAPALMVLATMIGASRPILGLHYPSDVLAGAAIGTLVAAAVTGLPL
jgi:undecaprenyl-diphosphatase